MHELDAGQRLLLDQLTEEYQQRHGVAVDYLKTAVGPGQEYSNAVARVVLSPSGVWFECIDQPMEFSGAAGGQYRHRFITDSEALGILEELRAAAVNSTSGDTLLFRLLCIYERAGVVDEQGAHVIHFDAQETGSESGLRTVGAYRPGILPLVYRCRFDTSRETAGIPFRHGVVVCLSGLGERNLFIEMPYTGKDVRNLAHPPVGLMPQ